MRPSNVGSFTGLPATENSPPFRTCLAWQGHRAAMSAPRAAAQFLRMPASLGYSFRPLLRGRGRRSAPSLPSRSTRTRRGAARPARPASSPLRRGQGWVAMPTVSVSTMSEPLTNPSASVRVIRRPSLVRLKRVVRLGVKSLWLHKLRSLLTVLGIVFGVCSVIAMLAIGEGASFEAQEQIKNLGSQNIILRSIKPPEEQKVSDKGSQNYVLQYGVTYKDVKRIRATIPGVTVVLPARNIRDYVWNISRRVDSEVVGTVPWYPEMRNHHVASGRFFTDTDMESQASVCVLGAEMVPALFPLESPLGKHVRVGAEYYQVIGIMEPRGQGPKI